MGDLFKVPLMLTPQPEGGYTVTSPVLPELLTEGDTVDEAIANVRDAVLAVIELYEDLGKTVPINLRQSPQDAAIWFEGVVAMP